METKICTKCKEPKELDQFGKNKKRKDGIHSWCKKCNVEYNKKHDSPEVRKKWINNNKEYHKRFHKDYYLKNKEKMNKQSIEYLQSLHGKFLTYKNGAKHRKIIFNLTEDEFSTFWQKPCYYCNDEIKTVGIDRINSKEEYSLNNCIPCCGKCNQIKMDISYDEFLRKIIKIYNNLKLWEHIEKLKEI